MPLPFISARYPIPTISSSRVHPLVTPSTALFTRARVNPCNADCESFSRRATIWPSCCSTLIPVGTFVSSLPFGPCTATVLPSILTVTPLGIAIGFFPIRDIKKLLSFSYLAAVSGDPELAAHCSSLNVVSLPNLAEDLASKTLFARLPPRHHTARRRQNIDSETAQHTGNLRPAHINAAAGTRHTLDVRDRGLVVVVVLQIYSDNLVPLFFRRLEVRNVAFFLQNAGNLQLQLRSGHIDFLVPGADRIANARKHVCDRIGQLHRLLLHTHFHGQITHGCPTLNSRGLRI